jgi:hypothetical protein
LAGLTISEDGGFNGSTLHIMFIQTPIVCDEDFTNNSIHKMPQISGKCGVNIDQVVFFVIKRKKLSKRVKIRLLS